MCADRELERWRPRFNASHFYPADTRGNNIHASHPSYGIKSMIGRFFVAVFLKMAAQSQKRRIAAASSSRPGRGVMSPEHGPESGKLSERELFEGPLGLSKPCLEWDGARTEKIGRRSSTALHVWSGRADASSSEVP